MGQPERLEGVCPGWGAATAVGIVKTCPTSMRVLYEPAPLVAAIYSMLSDVYFSLPASCCHEGVSYVL